MFYNGKGYLTRALQISQYKFNNNLMIAAVKGGGSKLAACYASYEEIYSSSSI